MGMDIRNAFRAGGAQSFEELHEMLGSLEAQLATLYEEKEQAGRGGEWSPAVASSGDEVIIELYERKARASAAALAEQQAMVDSLEAQLHTLYADREEDASLASALAGLEAQLAALYSEREEAGGLGVDELRAVCEGLDAQLRALYDERTAGDGRSTDELLGIIDGLEAQLHALYREREEQQITTDLGSNGVLALAETARNFEAQLASLYAERAAMRHAPDEADAMVDSLEAQVAALLEERNDLQAALDASGRELAAVRAKARDVVSALLDKTLA